MDCKTCKRTPGRVREVDGKVVSDALGWTPGESSPCPDCGSEPDYYEAMRLLGSAIVTIANGVIPDLGIHRAQRVADLVSEALDAIE